MILGIKVGPQKQSFLDLERTNAPFAEVWFDVNRADRYTELFDAMKRRNMQVGLHFWGALADGTMANIAYPNTELINDSVALVQKTIDIAARENFQYVNMHPGCAANVAIELTMGANRVLSEPMSMEQATEIFLSYAMQLNDYAVSRGIVLTFETVPIRCLDEWFTGLSRDDDNHVQNIYELPAEAIVAAAQKGLWVANDFGHTGANVITENPKVIWTYLKKVTQQLVSKTRLVHLNITVPPYNGTDAHDDLDNPFMETDQGVPNRAQMIELLQLFKNRHDVWVLVEPKSDHVKNYFLAQKILEEALGN